MNKLLKIKEKSMNYSNKSIKLLKKLKTNKNLTWDQISEKWNKEFAQEIGEKSVSALEKTYRAYKNKELVDDISEPHPYEGFTKESIGDIIKAKNIKTGRFFITAASPTNSLSDSSWKKINKKRYDYIVFLNTKEKKETTQVKEKNGKYYELVSENLFEPGLKSVLSFCEKQKAELLILPMRAHVAALQNQPNHFDPRLEAYLDKFVTEYTFNDYLMAFDAQLNPQQTNPLTGLNRIRHSNSKVQNTSLIVAHSKQMYEPKASGNALKPRVLYSTGCITKPEYLNNRVGRIAREDHELGGLIVEIKNNKYFIRPVQFDAQGTFIDLGTRYYPNGKTKRERAEFVNIGDEHAGHHTKELRNTLHDILKYLDPKAVGRNDLFDGTSINPHMKDNLFTKSKLPIQFQSIENELKVAKEIAFDILPHVSKDCKIYMIDSNHHDFLERYLKAGKYIYDTVNYEIAHRMIVMKFDKKNPLKEYLDPENKMIWLKTTQDLYVEGYQVNAHGHMGPDGARGSNINLEQVYGKVLKAHDHKIVKRHGLISCGHFSSDRHGYNQGPSTWLPGLGVIYKGGQVQTITVIDGEWKL